MNLNPDNAKTFSTSDLAQYLNASAIFSYTLATSFLLSEIYISDSVLMSNQEVNLVLFVF